MSVDTGDVVLDSVSLGAVGPLYIPVDQVTGTHSGTTLTLGIEISTLDATLRLSLSTL